MLYVTGLILELGVLRPVNHYGNIWVRFITKEKMKHNYWQSTAY